MDEHSLNVSRAAELTPALEKLCLDHDRMNLHHLERVIPSLRGAAYKILYDYWGEDYVKQILAHKGV